MNEYRFKTIITESVGNVIPGDVSIVYGKNIEDRGDYYAVILSNGERRYTKKYWRWV